MLGEEGSGAAATATGAESVEAGAATRSHTPMMTDEQWNAYVRHHLPEADDEELAHRVAMLKARDWAATLRGSATSQRAVDLAITAHETAGEHVFAPGITVKRLGCAARACRRLIGAALEFEQLDGEVDHVS